MPRPLSTAVVLAVLTIAAGAARAGDDGPTPALARCRDVICSAQLPDGAFRLSPTGDAARIVPYFSNLAALALLSGDSTDPADVHRVRRWIDWYTAHMEADGTIYDFVGTVADHPRTNDRDSTDSYAATFLQVIDAYANRAAPAERAAFIDPARKALAAIELTIDPVDGLTWAKPDYKAKYLMDNLEVCLGLAAAGRFFTAAHCPDDVARARRLSDHNRAGLAGFWRPDQHCYAWAKTAVWHVSFEKAYPDGLINAFAIAHVRPTHEDLWHNLQSHFANDPALTPDWWLLAANRAGTQEEIARYRRAAIHFAQTADASTMTIERAAWLMLALGHANEPIALAAPPTTMP